MSIVVKECRLNLKCCLFITLTVYVDLFDDENFITHAGCIAAGVGIAFSRVCLSVCLSALYKKNGSCAIDTKLCTRILYSSRLTCFDAEVKRSKVKVTRLRKPSRSRGC